MTHETHTFKQELEEKLEALFPKKKCKERGAALVLFAYANILFDKYKQTPLDSLHSEKDVNKLCGRIIHASAGMSCAEKVPCKYHSCSCFGDIDKKQRDYFCAIHGEEFSPYNPTAFKICKCVLVEEGKVECTNCLMKRSKDSIPPNATRHGEEGRCEHDSDQNCFACRLSNDLKNISVEPSNWESGNFIINELSYIINLCNVKTVLVGQDSLSINFVAKSATGRAWKELKEKMLQTIKR